MNVVHVIDSGGFYGAEVMLMHLCQAQQADGIKVSVISIGTPNIGEKPIEKIFKEKSISIIAYRMPALPDIRHGYKIIKVARNLGADIIHSHGYKGNILLGLIPKKFRDLPVIATLHGYTNVRKISKMGLYKAVNNWCIKRLDALVLVSKAMLIEKYINKLKNHLYIVENGIPSIELVDIKASKNNILSIGRLSKEKNFEFLIKSMVDVIKEIPESKLVIYGEGPERSTLENLIRTLKLDRHISMPGYSNDVIAAINNADVFVNCSLTEGMPITILEALRSGIPILASAIESNKEVLNDLIFQESFFNLKTTQELSNKIICNLKSEKTNQKRFKDFFNDRYTSKIMSDKYLEIYGKYINEQ